MINITPSQPYVRSTVFTKADVTAGGATAWTTANSGLTLFTVAGLVIARIVGLVGATAFTSTSDDGTLSVGITGSTQLFLPTTTVNNAAGQLGIGTVWQDATPTLKGKVLAAAPLTWATVGATPIILTVATHNMTAGAITLVCEWIPLTAGASVT